ncbi:MAG: polymer-forming cytoskeletal protein [Lachnospiraceae bacterium]|jgi:cytoskeletal protein CcmA (bactofilin family)|nr:polymer-forming cytoskeletal protein [Lachnospiraceae bacterium]
MDNFEETNNIETAVIPKGTVINGNISINGRLDMYGVVNGDINSDNQVNITGNVTGNINAQNLFTKDSFIVGQIACEKGAAVRENTVILGDIMAEDLVIDGAIQGNIDVRNGITIGDGAIVDSDIKAKTIQVNNGASINGTCSLCYADVDLEGIFPVVEEPEELEEDIITEESEEVAVEDDIPTEEIAAELTEVPVQLEKSEDKPKAVAKPRAVAKPKVVAKPKAIKKVNAE